MTNLIKDGWGDVPSINKYPQFRISKTYPNNVTNKPVVHMIGVVLPAYSLPECKAKAYVPKKTTSKPPGVKSSTGEFNIINEFWYSKIAQMKHSDWLNEIMWLGPSN